MQFDFQDLAPRDRFKLLSSLVVPRPIALTTTIDQEGRVNAAPFSFFNVMGATPPIVVIAPGDRPDGTPKDTARNIRTTGVFVINIVDEALADQMSRTATNFPPGMNELEKAGLTPVPSVHVAAPRIAEAPASLECREVTTLCIGQTRIVVGEVLHLHVHDHLVDTERMHVHTDQLRAVGRMHGGGWYTRTRDLFTIERMSFEQWHDQEDG